MNLKELLEGPEMDIYWVVQNTRTGQVRSVFPPDGEERAWNLADRLEQVGRRDHYIVIAGTKADYDKFTSRFNKV